MARQARDSVRTTDRSQPRDWPGERDPSRWDVHDANEVPGATFLQRFKAALLLSDDARGCQRIMPQLSPNDVTLPQSQVQPPDGATALLHEDSIRLYTYPMVMLSGLPSLPPDETVAELHAAFFTSFKRHVFLDALHIPGASQENIPPYLILTFACLGSALSPSWSIRGSIYDQSDGSTTSSLFLAATKLWSVMLEVDNREARLVEAVLSNILLCTYGTLTADEDIWSTSSELLSYVTTISRRLHLHDADLLTYGSKVLVERNVTMSSSLMSYLFLTDVVRAVHFGCIPHYSTCELFIRMPSSPQSFHTIYNCLATGSGPLPSDIQEREDALLLLIAILSDIIYAHRSLSDIVHPHAILSGGEIAPRNPYAPLSRRSEYLRLNAMLRATLDRWAQHFKANFDKEILSLFYFCNLYLACPEIWLLPRLAQYKPATMTTAKEPSTANRITISEEAMNFAWLVLDNIDIQVESPDKSQSIWIPVVLFYSALVIWQRLRLRSTSDLRNGTLKVLGMFKKELEQLPWECCAEMCRTLDRLMKS